MAVSASLIRQISGGSIDITPGYYLATPVCGIPGASGEYPIIVVAVRATQPEAGEEIRVLVAGQSTPYFPEQFVNYRPVTVGDDGEAGEFSPVAAALVIAGLIVYTVCSVVGALSFCGDLPFPWLPIFAGLVALAPLSMAARVAYQLRDQIADRRAA